MGTKKKLLFFLLMLPLAFIAKAGTGKSEGILHGYVTDASTKKPLSGVTVSAVVPGTSFLREVLTDSDGYFRIVQLPPAQVTVQFDKKGYQPCKRPNVTIVGDKSVRVNVEFLPDEMDSGPDDSEYPILRLLQAG